MEPASDPPSFQETSDSTEEPLKFLLGLCWAELGTQQTNSLPGGVCPLAGGRPGGTGLDLSEFLYVPYSSLDGIIFSFSDLSGGVLRLSMVGLSFPSPCSKD